MCWLRYPPDSVIFAKKACMNLLGDALNQYILSHSQPETPLLQKIRRETHLQVLAPQMLSGPLQGSLLAMLVRMMQPSRILEIGTFTGYATIWMAQALPESTLLYTIDANEELEDRVRAYLAEAGVAAQVDYRIGQALDVIPTIDDTLDMVFIDADKPNYRAYYDLVFDKVRPGGVILADNVLWHGRVVPGALEKIDKKTRAILDFNAYIQQDSRVENVLLPIRDGLMIAFKQKS